MSKHASPAVIGVFVVTAFALVLAGVLVFGSGAYFRDTANVIVYFDDSVAGLKLGAPVKFRGIEIGTVKDIRINMTGAIRDPQRIRIPVLLEIDQDRVTAQGLPGVDLDDPDEVKRLVTLGLRAELAFESFVTGVRYVALDVRPDTPARLAQDPRYPEIPSVRSPAAEIPDRVNQILGQLAELDLQRLVDSARSAIDHADHLLASPELARAVMRFDEISANLDRAVRELSPTIGAIRGVATTARDRVGPAAQLADRVDATLREIQAAARSLRRLADQLSRDPGSLLRGGTP